MQYRFSKGIFSHETALYLHAMTDRTPISYTMTFPSGYNTGNVRKQGIIAKLATTENYELGITGVVSPCGNPAPSPSRRRIILKHFSCRLISFGVNCYPIVPYPG